MTFHNNGDRFIFGGLPDGHTVTVQSVDGGATITTSAGSAIVTLRLEDSDWRLAGSDPRRFYERFVEPSLAVLSAYNAARETE